MKIRDYKPIVLTTSNKISQCVIKCMGFFTETFDASIRVESSGCHDFLPSSVTKPLRTPMKDPRQMVPQGLSDLTPSWGFVTSKIQAHFLSLFLPT